MSNKQKAKPKRLLSLLLALTMVLGMLPAMSLSVYAATIKGTGTIDDPYIPTDENTFMDALFWKNGKYIKLKNFTLDYKNESQWFKTTKDKVFILEGTNTLKQAEANYPLIMVDGCNLTIEGDGVLQYGMSYDTYDEFTSTTQPVFNTVNGGSITVNSGTFREVSYSGSSYHDNKPSGLFNGKVTVNDGLFIPQNDERNANQHSRDREVIDTSYIIGDPQGAVINGGIFENAFYTFRTTAYCSSDDYKIGHAESGWNDVSSYNIKNAVFRFDSTAVGSIKFEFSTREDHIIRRAFDKEKLVQTFIKNTQYNNLLLNKDALPCLKEPLISDLDVLKSVLNDMNEDWNSLDVVFMNGAKSLTLESITAAGTAPSDDREIQVVENTKPEVKITVSLTGRMKEYWDSLPTKDELVNELLRKATIYLYSADYSQTLTYRADGYTYRFTVTDNGNDTYTYKLTMPKMSAGDSYRLQVNTALFSSSITTITAYANPLTGRVQFSSGAVVGSKISVVLADGTVTQVKTPIYAWQLSTDGGKTWKTLTDANASKKNYIPLASQVGSQLRLCVMAANYSGILVSQPLTVTKAANNNMPVTPTLSAVKDEAGEYTTLVIHNYLENQEYVYYTYPVADQSKIEWTSTNRQLTSGTTTGLSANSTYYIYTRFKETEGTKAGTQIVYNYVQMSDPLYLQRVTLEGYTDSGDFNKIYVPLGESVTVNVNKEPYNAQQWSYCTFGPRSGSTDIYTVTDGKSVTDTMPYSITIRGDKVGTAELALYYRYGQSYYGMWNVVVYDPDGDIPTVTFYQQPDYDDITLCVGDSLTPAQQTVIMRPDEANAIYNTFEWYVCGSVSEAVNWTPSYYATSNPYISVNKTSGRVTALKDTSSLTGRYLAYKDVVLYAVSSDGGRVKIAQYAVDVSQLDIPLSSITIKPTSAKMEPGSVMTLTAVKAPSNTTVTDPVVWSLINGSNSFKIDANGKLTVSESAHEGEWAEVGVSCGGKLYNTCKITVERAKFGATVSGTVKSFGSDTDDVTVQLIAEGASEAAYETIVHGNTAGYSIEGVSAGTYTMKVMKKNHATGEYTVAVGNEAVIQDAEIFLMGDVNMDGTVSVNDVTTAQQGIAGLIELTDYQNKLADCNFDGILNVNDVTKLQTYIAGIIHEF
ncbi:MAG: dockerin type I repeat-containing protein [Ruminococcus sp.]